MGIVNDNSQQIHATLRAVGPVDGHFTTQDGSRRSFHVDGVLFYLKPLYLRFDLKSFGDRQFMFGSNASQYWVYSKSDDQTYCGPHGKTTLPVGLPVRPEQIVDALGLSLMAQGGQLGSTHRLIQRVEEKYQQVLFVELYDDGRVVFEKECWLDRYEPRLVRRVVFRNEDGVVEMTSELEGYKRLGSEGPWLPTTMSVDWPQDGADMRLKVRRWEFVEQVGPDSIQFAPPRDCKSVP